MNEESSHFRYNEIVVIEYLKKCRKTVKKIQKIIGKLRRKCF